MGSTAVAIDLRPGMRAFVNFVQINAAAIVAGIDDQNFLERAPDPKHGDADSKASAENNNPSLVHQPVARQEGCISPYEVNLQT
jgi:hypothetical protein